MQYVYRYGCYGRLTPEQMAGQLEPEYTPPKEREVCAYYSLCDHSGTGTSAGLLFTISAPDADLLPGISESGGDSYGGTSCGNGLYRCL